MHCNRNYIKPKSLCCFRMSQLNSVCSMVFVLFCFIVSFYSGQEQINRRRSEILALCQWWPWNPPSPASGSVIRKSSPCVEIIADISLNVQTNAKNQSQGIDGIRFTSALSSFVNGVSNQSIDPTSNQYYMDPVYKQRIIAITARFFNYNDGFRGGVNFHSFCP